MGAPSLQGSGVRAGALPASGRSGWAGLSELLSPEPQTLQGPPAGTARDGAVWARPVQRGSRRAAAIPRAPNHGIGSGPGPPR